MQPPENPYNQAPLPNPGGDPMRSYGGGFNGPSPFNATLLLVLGILGILCCQILGPVTWVMSNNAMAQLNAGQANESDRSMVNIARILGIIGTVLMILTILLYAFGFGAAILGGAGAAGGAGATGGAFPR